MSKRDKILLLILVLLVITTGIYYYDNYIREDETVMTDTVEIRDSEESDQNEDRTDELEARETAEEDSNKSDPEIEENSDTAEETGEDSSAAEETGEDQEETLPEDEIEEELEQEEEVYEKPAKAREESAEDLLQSTIQNYAYRREFRNPFQEYRIIESINNEDVLTLDEIKAMVPFDLRGVIGNNQERLAVIAHNGQEKIVEAGTVIDDFKISSIIDDGINISYRGVNFKIEMRSGLSEGI
ncbi:MAG: hypothetical protein ACLFUI_09155 [Halanaerobiales bacterium]